MCVCATTAGFQDSREREGLDLVAPMDGLSAAQVWGLVLADEQRRRSPVDLVAQGARGRLHRLQDGECGIQVGTLPLNVALLVVNSVARLYCCLLGGAVPYNKIQLGYMLPL